jgi:hypothetical protein
MSEKATKASDGYGRGRGTCSRMKVLLPILALLVAALLVVTGGFAMADSIVFGPEYVFNSADTSHFPLSVSYLTPTKFVVAFGDRSNSQYGTAVIGDVSGNTITYGAKSVFNSADTSDYPLSASALSSTKFVVAYADGGSSQYGTAVIGDVSGNTITYGSEYVFNPANTSYSLSVSALYSTKFVIAYADGGSSLYGTAVIGDVSGNTITYGAKYVFNPANTNFPLSVSALSSTKFVIAYADGGSSQYGTAVIGDVSGNTITYGSEYVFNSAWTSDISASALSSTKFVVAYADGGSSGYGTAVIGDVSGNTITYGSEYVFNPADTSLSLSASALSSTKFVVAYADGGSSGYGTAVIGTISTGPTVTTAAASSITSTTADSGGNVTDDGGASVIARGVCWSTSANPTTADSHTTNGTGSGVFTSNITGLTPGTLYHVRAYATNSEGTSYGSDLQFTTLATVPSVTTTAASSITSTTADSGGNVTDDGGASVTARGVCWSTSPNPIATGSHTTDGTGTGVFTSNVSGLSQGTLYYLRAYATNSVGTSYGSDVPFTTTNPVTPTAWYLAEGTNAWGFSTYITIENANNQQLTARLTYMDPNPQSGAGEVGTRDVTLPPLSQTTVSSEPDIGAVDFSTKVECLQGKTIAVDRTMFWTGQDALSPEGHSSIGTTTPSKTWYLPEGSSNWGFETWTLVQNPNATDAHVKLTYMTEGGIPQVFDKTVPAHCRATYKMAADIGAADASTKVTSDVLVVAERSMYRNNCREGSCSIGATAPAADFYLAEGATGYDVGFTTWVLIQNPNDSDVQVTLTYQTQSGAKPQDPFTMAANSRKTIRVNDQLPADTNVSTTVHGSKPIIAERAMYWGAGTPLGEAMHASIGLDSPHMTFYLPDGQTSSGFETWTLIQNPNPGAVTVRITYLPQGGGTPVSFTDEIPANTRSTYSMADKGINGRASIMVQSLDGARPVMVERAMYWNNRGAGTDTVGGFSD